MLMEEGIFLGHHISSKGIEVDPTKIRIIFDLHILQKQKDVRSFLGHTSYSKIFIKDFGKIASLMFSPLTKDADYNSTKEYQTIFKSIKKKLMSALVL